MKYMDIIPRRKSKKVSVKDLYEKLGLPKNYYRSTGLTDNTVREYEAACLHKQCPNCNGTGFGKRGVCVHMISCPCVNCTPRMVMGIDYAEIGKDESRWQLVERSSLGINKFTTLC